MEKKWDKHYLKLVGTGKYEVEISDSDVGTITRMENVTNDFEREIKTACERKERAEQEVMIAKFEVDQPFEHQSEMEALQSELAEINAELDLGHTNENIVLENEMGELPKIEILDEREEEAEIA